MVSFHGVFPALLFFHLNLHEVVQRARPSYNPRGTCPRLVDTSATPVWAKTRIRTVPSTGRKRRNVLRKLALALANAWFSFLFLACTLLLSSFTLTSMRSCNGHVPLIIQEGHARAGQIPQPGQDGQNPNPDSSKHWWKKEMFG
jgi:hypothetical protein